MIEVLDNNIGKILNTVDQLGLINNTVILFLNDDGPSPGYDLSYSNRRMNDEEKAERMRGWAKKYRGGKGSIWQGGSITPFYFQWSGKIQPGEKYEHLSGVIDIFPTILDVCGIQQDNQALPLHGRSLWPILNGKTPEDWSERMYFDNTNFYLIPRSEINLEDPQMHHIALYYKNYKLIRGNNALYRGADSVYYLLYDLAKDPMESDNIFEKNDHITTRLVPEIEAWYDRILENGRAFHQPIFEIGNWEESNSPINLDAKREVWGSCTLGNQSGFRIGSWTSPESGINFDIDIIEEGTYVVELGYSVKEQDLGSIFKVYTQYDTAELSIQNMNSALSEPLYLPAGEQVLNIELFSLGGGQAGIDVLNKLIVHRTPRVEDSGIIKNAGMVVVASDKMEKIFKQTSAATDFLFGMNDSESLEIRKGTYVTITFFVDNEEEIDEVVLFNGFEKIETITEPPFSFSYIPEKYGKHTLNLEFKSKEGVVNAIHGDLLVISE
jgi:hypothetical protein